MRTLADVADEAIAENNLNKFFLLQIMVGFEQQTKFVGIADRETMLFQLATLVRAGGDPIGLIGMVKDETVKDENCLHMYARLFVEHAHDEALAKYLEALMHGIKDQFIAAGITVHARRNAH